MWSCWWVFMWIICCGWLQAAAGNTFTFELTWQEDGFSQTLDATLDRSKPFDNEPDFESQGILRGELTIGLPGHQERMGFAWDKAGKLYMDLNRDGDLTNDPNGVLLAKEPHRGRGYCNQNFPTFPLSVSTELGTYQYRLRAFLQSYGDHYKRAQFYVNSGYSGNTDLYGRRWTVKVNDKPGGVIERGNQFSLVSTDDPSANSISALPLPASVFFDDRCYEIGFEFKKEHPSPSLWCTLREKTIPTGHLQIESKWVQQLVLGDGAILIVPEPVEGVAIVPTGNLTVKQCHLKYKPEKPAISPTHLNDIQVSVQDDDENILHIGGPFQNSVHVERVGKVLKFNYELKGAGGETYDARQITNYDNSKKPSVAIYQGGMQVGSGDFEYG